MINQAYVTDVLRNVICKLHSRREWSTNSQTRILHTCFCSLQFS